jgi:hypothetical protein
MAVACPHANTFVMGPAVINNNLALRISAGRQDQVPSGGDTVVKKILNKCLVGERNAKLSRLLRAVRS